ncbi:DUF11 domain-containing protein [Pontibacter qinzhouensis]|uniref:DUF11 domain-containing protein n=1 Tax=Pontibacter qinzhouensis TaxID=2603253 RepID=A0A5C8KBS0_9BACT|nr:T9SS type A sorting domain-containing protein [Pontibacter qinzhouensis]TXK52846.1 DUF11 domain-containing protein [Pontibacter qinzhouensis]
MLIESSGSSGSRTVEWSGLDGLGNRVPTNTTLTYNFKNASAPINFPMWDAEWNDGFRVADVRPLPSSGYTSELYWDHTNLPTSAFPTPQSNLFGSAPTSTNTTGINPWGSSSSFAGDLRTVNTWTYGFTNVQNTTSTFTYDCSADVGVTNVASAGPYTVGKPFTYTVTVTNNGPIVATNVRVTDLLDPNQLNFISSSVGSAYNVNTGVWTVGSLAVGATQTMTITASPRVTGTISTTATQTHTEPDNVTSNNSATATITVVPAADIEVRNTASGTTFNNGDLVTYTVTARNLGPNAATGVVVTDRLPAGLTLEGAVPAGYDAATGNWTVGNLAVNETKTLTLTARISTLGSITTTATLGSRANHQLDENANNNTASNTITVTPSADVAVTNVVSNATPNQNGSITYTIQATNNGPNNATNVILSGALPAGLNFTGFTASLGTVTLAGSTGTWTVGTIQPNTTQTLTLTATPTATGVINLTLAQTHTEFDNNAANNSATSTITVGATADVAVTNTVSAPADLEDGYTTNETVTYTVEVKNNGPSAATNVVVTDKLPANLTFLESTATTGSYVAASGIWTVGTLANGASATLTIKATINESAVITTTATQTHTEFDNVAGNNSASNTITSGSGVITADIAVTVSTPQTNYYTGNEVPFRVLITNNGPDAATNVNIMAALPAGMTFVSADPRGGTYSNTNNTWTIPALASGAYTELFLIGKPAPDTSVPGAKTYNFTATASGTPAQADSNPNNNTATTSITVNKQVDVATTVTVTSNDPEGNFYHNVTEATFRMTVTNNGPDVVTNLKGMDTRTGTLNFILPSLTTSPGTTYSVATGIWDVGTLAPGESAYLEITGVPNRTGRLNLGGGVTEKDQTDLNQANNTAVALLNVLPVADLAITNTASSATFNNGEEVSFTVVLQNNGPDAASGVVIADVLPDGLTFVRATATAGAYDATTGLWTLGTDVLPGEANAQTLVLTVRPQAAASYTTTATVQSSEQYDNNASNNSQSATIQGTASADIAVGSSVVSGPYYVGGQYQVTITASNIGPDPATGVVIAAGVAPGLILVPGSGRPSKGTIDPATGLWTVGNLGVNETDTLTLLAQPTRLGELNSIGYKYAANEFDSNGGNDNINPTGNNITYIFITAVDRPVTYEVVRPVIHMFSVRVGYNIAEVTDPDGPIVSAKVVEGTLPAGIRLLSNGELEVERRTLLVPGTYTLSIATTDANGSVDTSQVSFTISDDFDGDGVPDAQDIDRNNDGLVDNMLGGIDPLADEDGDGIPNFLDTDFVHPLYGAFRDRNSDGINDIFDMDLDGQIIGFDIDEDGDGIVNAVEANRGVVPTAAGYDAIRGIFTGAVAANGMPVAATAANLPNPDTDGDGKPDYQDVDSDNDGILDNIEAQTTAGYINSLGTDSNLNGLRDGYDPAVGGVAIVPIDTDGDGIPDYLDLDSDSDLVPDFIEAFDDNENGQSGDDLIERARIFELANNRGWYLQTGLNADGIPAWLQQAPGQSRPAYLTPGNPYYHDTDNDGIIDLFDIDNGGRGASLQIQTEIEGLYEYSFRAIDVQTVLPVTLISFSGSAQKDGVQLRWATATEKDNAYFEVQRSTDGKNFQTIGKVAGKGNSSVRINYAYIDAKPVSGTVFYRLKQVDFDGAFEYSFVISVSTSNLQQAPKAKLYPNPVAAIAHLDMTMLPAGQYQIRIITMEGRTIQQKVLNSEVEQQLDLRNLSTGKYILQIQGAGTNQTISFIKH